MPLLCNYMNQDMNVYTVTLAMWFINAGQLAISSVSYIIIQPSSKIAVRILSQKEHKYD